jgi:hypothetical protein
MYAYSVVLWDLSDPLAPSEIVDITLPVGVTDATFGGDGELLAIGYYTPAGFDTGVLVFGVGKQFLRLRSCDLAGRRLTSGEAHRFSTSNATPSACR